MLLKYCFDNPDLIQDFKQSGSKFYEMYDSFIKVNKVITIGSSSYDEFLPKGEKDQLIMKKLFLMTTHALPGRHSVFVYMPQTN